MGEARLKGSATKITGKVKEGAGNVSGHPKLKREGIFDQIKGKVQTAFGGMKDAMRRK
jgi:uncharacterized protein YjbJ (UPF0337 family)